MDILNRINDLLNGREQQELTNYLGLKKTAFSDWKGGKSNSYRKYLIEIAEFFDVSIDFLVYGKEKSSSLDLTDKEQEIIDIYRELPSDHERGELLGYARRMKDAGGAVEEDEYELVSQTNCIVLTMYEDAVSAGTGEYLNDGRCVEVKVDETELTDKADCILRVSGDSMEPTYYDGDKVLVQYTKALDVGDIGIFTLNGEGYIKEYTKEGLLSHNSKYSVIPVLESDRFEVVGKVLGKM